MMETKVATTAQLLALINHGENEGLNRLPTAGLNYDPAGLHVLKPVLIHDAAGGVKVTPHMRCHVCAKLMGQEDPAEFFLDTSIYLLDLLPPAQPVAELARSISNL
jgi:hypothetical protein